MSSILPGKYSIDALPCQVFQMLLRGLARRHRFVGIRYFSSSSVECDAAGKAHGFGDRLRHVAKQPRHFLGRLQNAARRWPRAGCPTVSMVVFSRMQVRTSCSAAARRDRDTARHWSRAAARRPSVAMRCKPRQTALVVAAIQQAGGEPHAIGAAAAQSLQHPRQRIAVSKRYGRHQHQQQSFAEFQEVIESRWHSPFSVVATSPRLPRVSNGRAGHRPARSRG